MSFVYFILVLYCVLVNYIIVKEYYFKAFTKCLYYYPNKKIKIKIL